MSDPELTQDAAYQLRRALGAVRDLREKLQAVEGRAHEPIAIIGMACRLPGGPDLAAFWRTLVEGRDPIREVPPERWDLEALYDPDPDAPGKMNTRWGGLIDDVDRFDPTFFGISPREAVSIDPQQRLLLEVAWHALEHAGIAPDRLTGSLTGVYVGLSTHDYAEILGDRNNTDWIDAHASLGNSAAVAAGRLAYTLGLQGPALVVDTACSSSLVAIHLAAQALRTGEIGLALVGGVNLTLRPELTIGFSKARMMAADGRCKTFDAAADGYVRGEGCGVVVLKRLSDALAAGDRIEAIIRGSAVNQDGHSNGLTAPNGPAQVAVIRAALANAGVEPAQVSCIEAHGTGTTLGDPIEARALTTVFGGERAGALPAVGSVKTQIGHLEAAAGIAGLIKVALALRHATLPPHLHFHTLNPHIAADGFPFHIPTVATPWLPVADRRIAGVSSFGFSGTNAHIVLEEAPRPLTPSPLAGEGWGGGNILALSARDLEALNELRRQTDAAVAAPNADLAGLAATLSAGRAQFACRIAVVADHAEQARKALASAQPVRVVQPPAVAFLFTGQGCQYPGMARGLMAEPRFREIIERCETVLAGRLERSLTDLLLADDASLDRTDLLQPALFALEYAIAELWRGWGVEPVAVLGHSVGEIAAACFAGAMSLEEGLTFISERGRLMATTAGQGGMAAAFAPPETVAAAIAGTGAVIAAHNGPANTVVSGDTAALIRVLAALEQADIPHRRLDVATAFHSPVLDPCLDALEQAAAAVSWHPARLPIASNLTGALIHQFDAGYWRRQAREPVAFTEGLQALADRGCTVFLEVGPRPILSALGREIVDGAEFIAALRQGIEPQRALTEALARLYTAGAPVDWNAYWGPGRRRVEAPLYPFRRDRFWPAKSEFTPHAQTLSHQKPAHPLLGHWLDTPLPQRLFETWMTIEALPFLADHVVFGEVVVPGAMHVVLALIAAQVAAIPSPALDDVVFAQALTVPPEGVRVQFILEPSGAFALHSRREGQQWVRHATGHVATEPGNPPGAENLEALRTRLTRDEAGTEPLFAMLSERGIRLGPAFQGIQTLWRGAGEALAEIRKPAALGDTSGLPIHPALLDACFQTLGATFSGEGAAGGFLPLSIDRVRCWRSPPERFWCHVTTSSGPASAEVAVGHFRLLDAAGQVCMTVEGLQIKRVAAPAPADPLADAFLELDWIPAPLPDPDWADPTPLADAARALDTGLPTDQGLANDLERLATAFAADALRTLGLEPESNADATECGIAESRRRLFHRVAEIAALDPEAAQIGGEALAKTLHARYPANALEIDLVARCGGGLAGVLTGQADPLQLLFTPGDNIYSDSGLARVANAMTAAAVAEALQRRGPGPVRILEVGAGTGATTAALLPLLQGRDGSHYQFTDLAPAFLTTAQRTFNEQPGIEFTRFDLEQAPATQGLTPGSFDIVVAANVVHATADLRRSLTHLHTLLAPGGLLALVESTAAQRWWDLVFGLTEGWWRFTDTDLRPRHPLLPAETWRSLLTEQGFAATVAVGIDPEARQSLILARAGGEAAPLFAVHDGNDGPARQLAEALTQALQSRGGVCEVLSAAEALLRLAETASAGVVYTGGVGAAGETALHQAFDLIRAMVAAGRERLWLVTQGAQSVTGIITQPDSALLWGLGKVAALEHPELRCRRVDLDPAAPNPAADLLRELLADDAEPETAWRGSQRYVSRLSPASLPAVVPPTFDPQGRYLVSGAFGGLGPLLVEWLIERGAGALMLIGHRPPALALAERLQALEPRVQLRVADVADRVAMSRLFAELDQEGLPLRGVFHLAGGVADGALLQQDWDRFASVLPAKVEGARILDALTRDRALDYFVLFSTSAALIGNRGQANHAAANAVLDALAHARRAHGLPGLSLNWGAWGEIGAVVDGAYAERLQASGAKPISPAVGLEALSRALQSNRAQLGVIPVDWPIFLAGYGEHIPPFFERLVRAPVIKSSPVQRSPEVAPATVGLRAQLAAINPEQRRTRLMTLLQTEAATVLGIAEPERIDPDQPLSELGLDSLLALELRTRLGTATGGKLPATLLFNYPSVAALTGHLLDEVLDLGSTEPVATARSANEDALRAEIAELSEADLEALIDDELSNLI